MFEFVFGFLVTFTRGLPNFRGKERIGKILTEKFFNPEKFQKPIREVLMKDDSRMILDARTRMEQGAFWSGLYEPHLLKKLIGFLEKNDCVLDIGANVGFIAISIGRHLEKLKGGHVYAFEPVPGNYERLEKARELNALTEVLTTYRMALGTEDGELEMAMEQGGNSGNAVQRTAVENLDSQWQFSTAPMQRLDDMWKIASCPNISLIKIDVEGAELFVFQGGPECLTVCQPVILAEFNSFWMKQFGYTKEDVMSLPCFREYDYYHVPKHGNITAIVGDWSDMGDVLMIPRCLDSERRSKLLGNKG